MPDLFYEQQMLAKGFKTIAGVDEAGRGPLAGPVSAAAVILPLDYKCPGLNDSKKLTPEKRDALYDAITNNPDIRWAVATASQQEIDKINIQQATHLAMRRALDQLDPTPDHCLIDGLPIKKFPYSHIGVIKGDSLSLSIAAASIIAKVTRDRMMAIIDKEFPEYQFAKHQGYGTTIHLNALRKHGPCHHHRMTFRPIKQLSPQP